ncbi:hypothetical protein E4U33_004447, partial [Claviceps sp. LM78 group G4]
MLAVDMVGHNARDIQELCGGEPDSALACDIALGHGLRISARTQDAAVVSDKVVWALNHLGCGFDACHHGQLECETRLAVVVAHLG